MNPFVRLLATLTDVAKLFDGDKKIGKWAVEKDELCLYLNESDDGCYEVSLSDKRVEMKPLGLGATLEGFLQTAPDPN